MTRRLKPFYQSSNGGASLRLKKSSFPMLILFPYSLKLSSEGCDVGLQINITQIKKVKRREFLKNFRIFTFSSCSCLKASKVLSDSPQPMSTDLTRTGDLGKCTLKAHLVEDQLKDIWPHEAANEVTINFVLKIYSWKDGLTIGASAFITSYTNS